MSSLIKAEGMNVLASRLSGAAPIRSTRNACRCCSRWDAAQSAILVRQIGLPAMMFGYLHASITLDGKGGLHACMSLLHRLQRGECSMQACQVQESQVTPSFVQNGSDHARGSCELVVCNTSRSNFLTRLDLQ